MTFQNWRSIAERAAQIAWEAKTKTHLEALLTEENMSPAFNRLALSMYDYLLNAGVRRNG